MTRLVLLLVALVLVACTQPETRRSEAATSTDAAARCVEACVFARQMEARSAEAIQADCRAECAKDDSAWPKPDGR